MLRTQKSMVMWEYKAQETLEDSMRCGKDETKDNWWEVAGEESGHVSPVVMINVDQNTS